MRLSILFPALSGILAAVSVAAPIPWTNVFTPDERWETYGKVSATAPKTLEVSEEGEGTYLSNAPDWKGAPYLKTAGEFGDCSVEMEFMIPKDANSGVYMMGRYEVQILDSFGKKDKPSHSDLGGIYWQWDDEATPQGSGGTPPSANAAKPPGEWQKLEIEFRAPRLDEAGKVVEKPVFLSVKVNGVEVQKNTPVDGPTRAHPRSGAAAEDSVYIQGDHGAIAIRKFVVREENFKDAPPVAADHEKKKLDLVQYGKQSFHSLGCAECHSEILNDPAVRTGPTLYGLFQKTPRKREVSIAAEGVEPAAAPRKEVLADMDYFIRSLRTPATEMAIAESGPTEGDSYLPVMPPYPVEVVDDLRLKAIHHYLATLNEASRQGPGSVVIDDPRQITEQDVATDPAEILVTDRTRVYRARLEKGSSRAVYVGTPAGLNYSFDPIDLSIRRVWWGGFLNLKNEMDGRAGPVSTTGHEAEELSLGGPLLVPHHLKTGAPIDLSFKSPLHADTATIEKNLYGAEDFADQLAAAGADFQGYTLSPDAAGDPSFHYSVGENEISLTFHGERDGKTSISISGKFKSPQAFSLNTQVMADVSVDTGEIMGGVWTVPAADAVNATVSFSLPPAQGVWRPMPGAAQVLSSKVTPVPSAGLELPPGYSGMEIPPPLDRNGRLQLFEPLGMDIAKDGTLVVSTRTAGVWKFRDNTWTQVAEGLLDAMGVIIEKDDLSEIVVGQKPELTRLIDHDGDGITDEYQTISDDFGFTTNYHEYLHGPAKGADGNYYVSLNLSSDESRHVFRNGARWMGTTGGYRGWALQISPDGKTVPFANGLRSPAGIGTGPDGLVYYTDNQGSYFGTSKFFLLKKDAFYGQPASLVDLPGLTPDSPELTWENVQSGREEPIALLPHSHLTNSPGSPVWDLTEGKFGPTDGNVFIGDQTLSTLFRLIPHEVEGHAEAAVLPFGKGFPSGVMRSVFATDGSLYVGQTGRGWRSQGGNEAALVHITYDPAEASAMLHDITRDGDVFTITFTEPVEVDTAKITAKSWTYVDSPTYGSPETDRRDEEVSEAEVSSDRKSVSFRLENIPPGGRVLSFKIPAAARAFDAFYSKR